MAVKVAVRVGVPVGPVGVVVTVGCVVWVVVGLNEGPCVGANKAVRVRSGVGARFVFPEEKEPHAVSRKTATPTRIKIRK